MKKYFYSAVVKDGTKEIMSCGVLEYRDAVDFNAFLGHLTKYMNTAENQKLLGYEIPREKIHVVSFNRID